MPPCSGKHGKNCSDKFNGGQAVKNQLFGEGHFLRAYTYFYITRIWGDPVLTKESFKDPLSVQPFARSPEAEVLDYCIENKAGSGTYLISIPAHP